MRGDAHYALIESYYGSRRAKRSGVLYMKHIDEGLAILDAIAADLSAKRAFCLHPIVQSDEDLRRAPDSIRSMKDLDPVALLLAVEYRSVANEYLSPRRIRSIEEIRLSPLEGVQQMLVADKVQNRKDFERHHRGTHPRSRELEEYFANWLRRLGVSEERYRELAVLVS